MNKIIVKNDNITLLETDDTITVTFSEKFDIYDIRKLKIQVTNSTKIEIDYENNIDAKLDISIDLSKNSNLKLTEIRNGSNVKVQYHYYLNENSILEINKFYNSENIKELDIVNLNGKYARFDYNFKTICHGKQNFDMMVYHNYQDTFSNINNKGINIEDGELNFTVTNIVPKRNENCEVEQNSRIINFTNNKCIIKPNLLIDEANVIANHSALIGKFSDEEIFYLQSRGINKKEAINLLVRGFILEGFRENKKINEIIDKYWR